MSSFSIDANGSQINAVKDMKREILEIADDLSNDAITPQQAQTLLLRLFVVSGSLPIAVASIRSNFELWRKGEINDGAFSWHLQNNLLRIEKELGWSFKGNDR